MIEFLTHHGLASNWTVWERALELRRLGAQHLGTSLGQMERMSSPGDANDSDLSVHVVQRDDNGHVVGYARLHPRPISGNFDASRPRMRLELERVFVDRARQDTDKVWHQRSKELMLSIIRHAKSHDYDVISGYGERGGVSALEQFGLLVKTKDQGFIDGDRVLYRFKITISDLKGSALPDPERKTANAETQTDRKQTHRPTAASRKEMLEDLEAAFDVDIKACRRSFESENLSLEAA